MKIMEIYVNHMVQPVGYQLDDLRIEFKVSAEEFVQMTKQLTIWTTDKNQPVYQTKPAAYETNYFDVDLTLAPRTRYFFEISLSNDEQCIIGESFFETGKLTETFAADWIANQNKKLPNTLFKKTFSVAKAPISARLYMTGLGVYEAYLDDNKIGDEYLAPGVTAYDQWVQVQTYDVSQGLEEGNHTLTVSTGDGWYKSPYGFDGGKANIYGDQHMIIGELYLNYADGSQEIIKTDASWQTTSGQITHSGIYYGEDIDATIEITDWQPVVTIDHNKNLLQDRLSLPLKVKETIVPKALLKTPLGEDVLNFGQNQAGWLTFYSREPKGTKITFEMSEVLQEDNFYRDNLREARAAFVYISDGEEKWVRPHFTYYGYRYVRITGSSQPIQLTDYKAQVIYSDMKDTGNIITDNSKVNRLFENVRWSQKSNFFDVPTDCPQRDERLGWTGDATVFSNTAAFNMDVFQFFKKYMKDVAIEQARFDGMVPMYAPAMGTTDGGAAVWGDAATVIPWNMYETYGDSAILRQNYVSMKAWVDWITQHSKTENLWTGMFQFGDWIALDGENPALPTGKTDEDFIASVYYYYSSLIVAQTAEILGYEQDVIFYKNQAESILSAIRSEYITAKGRLSIDTQTAYALALYFELVPAEQLSRVSKDLVSRLSKDNDHLQTGFVGTPFICQVLSKYGEHKLATKIFLHEDFPSWLYAVNMGATTVWERWNSIEPSGTMNPDGMNSLNHYSIGAIMEWGYKYVLGIKEHTPGFKTLTYAPNFDYRLKHVSGYFKTPYGKFVAEYQIEADEKHTIHTTITVPFGVSVQVDLPRSSGIPVQVNGNEQKGGQFVLTCGTYHISYIPTENYVEYYHAETPVADIMADPLMMEKIDEIDDVLNFFRKDPAAVAGGLGSMSLTKLNTLLPFIHISVSNLEKINQALVETPIISERH
ncbi:alfa-L-rhamnosidase [Enterococcus sp. JM4C]|uniref:alpha-L-rhamnosidase n=1 Tax=Candidatus Enterococcus huntleyi TaxID=1857217 RepID=UPI0013794DBA|nr:alpha-L-rhamnosidase [Enterococcus sp. JM4C]KAF1299332.1 alfa-L-rhamnosidase [Enterococcus sp. JM4C]